VLSRKTISADTPWLLSLAKAEGGDLAWTHPVGELCKGLSGRPDSARQFGGDVLMVQGGSLCMVDLGGGRARWQTDAGERAGELKLLQLEVDGPVLDAWFAGELGRWVHARVDTATGTIERQTGKST